MCWNEEHEKDKIMLENETMIKRREREREGEIENQPFFLIIKKKRTKAWNTNMARRANDCIFFPANACFAEREDESDDSMQQ